MSDKDKDKVKIEKKKPLKKLSKEEKKAIIERNGIKIPVPEEDQVDSIGRGYT